MNFINININISYAIADKFSINSSNRFKLKSTQYISIPTRISSGKCEMKVRFTHNKTISLKAYLQISQRNRNKALVQHSTAQQNRREREIAQIKIASIQIQANWH